MSFYSFLKLFIVGSIKNFLNKIGFVNYYIWKVDGPLERLILKDNDINIDASKSCGYVNTLFNTNSGTITIGNGVIFGHNCMVLTGKHEYLSGDVDNLRKEVPQGRDIIIGDGVWIASGAIILGNVHIGDHAVIMAGAIVTKSVESYAVVAGIPARTIKKYK